jgi:acyl-CoA thioester hydrolase
VSAADTAPAGGHHVYYAIYAFYMDRAVADQLASLGYERRKSFEQLHGFDGIRHMEIEYLGSAVGGDDLVVETRVESIRGVRLTRTYEIRRESTGETLVKARTTAVWITDRGRPGRWPLELVTALTRS